MAEVIETSGLSDPEESPVPLSAHRGFIRWDITDFSRQDDKIYSEVFHSGPHQWRVIVYPRGNKSEDLSLYLDSAKSSLLPPRVPKKAHFTLSIINQLDPKKTFLHSFTNVFNKIDQSWGWTTGTVRLTDIMDESKGYKRNDVVMVECHVQVITADETNLMKDDDDVYFYGQEGSLRFPIKDFGVYEEKKILFSDPFMAGDHKWKLSVYPKGNDSEDLSLYLEAAEPVTLPCTTTKKAHFVLAIENQDDSKKSFRQTFTQYFTKVQSSWGLTTGTVRLEAISDEKNGWKVNDSVVVAGHVQMATKAVDHDSRRITGFMGLKKGTSDRLDIAEFNMGRISDKIAGLILDLFFTAPIREAVYHYTPSHTTHQGKFIQELQRVFFGLQYSDTPIAGEALALVAASLPKTPGPAGSMLEWADAIWSCLERLWTSKGWSYGPALQCLGHIGPNLANDIHALERGTIRIILQESGDFIDMLRAAIARARNRERRRRAAESGDQGKSESKKKRKKKLALPPVVHVFIVGSPDNEMLGRCIFPTTLDVDQLVRLPNDGHQTAEPEEKAADSDESDWESASSDELKEVTPDEGHAKDGSSRKEAETRKEEAATEAKSESGSSSGGLSSRYELRGVIVQTLDKGSRYFVRPHPDKKDWFKFESGYVCQVPEREAVSANYGQNGFTYSLAGGVHTCKPRMPAAMLIYKRLDQLKAILKLPDMHPNFGANSLFPRMVPSTLLRVKVAMGDSLSHASGREVVNCSSAVSFMVPPNMTMAQFRYLIGLRSDVCVRLLHIWICRPLLMDVPESDGGKPDQNSNQSQGEEVALAYCLGKADESTAMESIWGTTTSCLYLDKEACGTCLRAGMDIVVGKFTTKDRSNLANYRKSVKLDRRRVGTSVSQFPLLHLGAAEADARCVQAMVRSGMAVVQRHYAYGGATALHMSAEHGRRQIISALCEAIPLLNNVNQVKHEQLLLTNEKQEDDKELNGDEENGSDNVATVRCAPDAVDVDGQTALHYASRVGHLGAVQALLEHHAPCDIRSRNGETALHAAVTAGHDLIVIELLKHGADKTIENNEGRSPYDMASKHLRSIMKSTDVEVPTEKKSELVDLAVTDDDTLAALLADDVAGASTQAPTKAPSKKSQKKKKKKEREREREKEREKEREREREKEKERQLEREKEKAKKREIQLQEQRAKELKAKQLESEKQKEKQKEIERIQQLKTTQDKAKSATDPTAGQSNYKNQSVYADENYVSDDDLDGWERVGGNQIQGASSGRRSGRGRTSNRTSPTFASASPPAGNLAQPFGQRSPVGSWSHALVRSGSPISPPKQPAINNSPNNDKRLAALASEMKSLRKQISDLHELVFSMESEIGRLREENTKLKGASPRSDPSMEALAAENDGLRGDLVIANVDLDRLRAERVRLVAQAGSSSSEAEDDPVMKENELLSASLEKAVAGLQALKTENDRLNALKLSPQ